MDQRTENHGRIAIHFQPVRLPRVMYVAYPRRRDDILACWESGATILIATDKAAAQPVDETDDLDIPPPTIFGYCQLDARPWQETGWITHLIIDRPVRRRKIGTQLLKASIAWGRSQRLRKLMIAVQTKNYPAISFCEKHNFTFCGFNDHYFTNRDIALFFTLRL